MPTKPKQQRYAIPKGGTPMATNLVNQWRVVKITVTPTVADSNSKNIAILFRNELSLAEKEERALIPNDTLSDYISYLGWFCDKFDAAYTPNDFECS
jgi:hypothetical protein